VAETLTQEEAIFHAALKIDAVDQRSAYLDALCGGEASLRRRVEALLRRHAEAEGPLDRPAFAGAATEEPCAERPGTVIGPYKLLELIGEGGMGLVFMAEQTQPVRRRVALKVVKPGMDTRQVVARFEAERQALALMDHPHIAKVFDAGVTESGRPYFVMELVRGVPVTEYCDEHRLTTRQRLELFVSVCQAVQHAHQKGIIHRDLKPSNVLVTQHDTVAVPKIIDFGIAKATGSAVGGLTERTLFTNFAQMMGTPLYMSPEQAEMNGLDVDTRSDVYSLGVMLYELLTGTTPFETETLKKVGLDEMRRMIREDEPPTPSRRLSTLSAQDCSTVSDRRGTDGRRLGQVLHGELDWIVMKALEKDRDRRYESASALAADVQRYLHDEAVEACPPSAGYRLRKYARRNRRELVTAGVVAVALVTATVVSTWQAVRARQAQHQAETDRDRAEAAEGRSATDSAIAKAVADFLQQDLLRQVNPRAQRDEGFEPARNLTVKEALDRAAGRIGRRFEDQPLVEATIQITIANAYAGVGERPLALPHMERAFALRKTLLGPDDPDTIDAMKRLAGLCQLVGRFAEAITLHKQILENCEARLGPDDPETLVCMSDLAGSYDFDGQWGMSLLLRKHVLEKQRVICGPAHPDTLRTMQGLAMNYTHVGQFHESVALHEKVLKLRQSMGDAGTWFLITYGIACQGAGKLDQAGIQFHKVLAQRRDRDPYTLGWLARNLLLQERYAEAEPIAREAVAIYEQERPEDPEGFYFVSILGAVLCGQQNYTRAEPVLLRGYEGMKRREASLGAVWKLRMGETAQRVVHFYEVTNQPEKARAWREKTQTKLPDPASAGIK
jgi:serine/threonine protein kinase